MVKSICQKSTGTLALGDHGMVQNLAGKTAAKQKQQQLNSYQHDQKALAQQ